MKHGARWGGLAGIASVALVLVPAIVFFSGRFPDPGDSPAEMARLLREERTAYLVGIAFEIVSLAVILWFYASLRSVFEHAADNAIIAARIMFAGAVALSVLIWVEDSILAASARLADRYSDPSTVASTREIGLLVAWPSARVATALVLIATAVAVFRTRALHAAVGWFAVVVAIPNAFYIASVFADEGGLAPASDTGELLAVGAYYAWVLVAAIALIMAGRRSGFAARGSGQPARASP